MAAISFSAAVSGTRLRSQRVKVASSAARVVTQAAAGTQKLGTSTLRRGPVKSIEFNELDPSKAGKGEVRLKNVGKPASAPKLLAKLEELRLLSKIESLGLLSAAERAGISLEKVQQLGLLSTAENLGLLSLATDRSSPGKLTALAVVLAAIGPAVAYAVPETSGLEIAAQVLAAGLGIAGGAAAFGGATLLSALQAPARN